VFVVQGKPREAAGIVKVIKDSRRDALRAAKDFLDQGFPFVSIIGDGHVYTIEEFALPSSTIRPPKCARAWVRRPPALLAKG
jgi:hypothetical protein